MVLKQPLQIFNGFWGDHHHWMFFGGLAIATNGFSMVFDFAAIAFNGFWWFRTIGQTMRWFRWIVVVYHEDNIKNGPWYQGSSEKHPTMSLTRIRHEDHIRNGPKCREHKRFTWSDPSVSYKWGLPRRRISSYSHLYSHSYSDSSYLSYQWELPHRRKHCHIHLSSALLPAMGTLLCEKIMSANEQALHLTHDLDGKKNSSEGTINKKSFTKICVNSGLAPQQISKWVDPCVDLLAARCLQISW